MKTTEETKKNIKELKKKSKEIKKHIKGTLLFIFICLSVYSSLTIEYA